MRDVILVNLGFSQLIFSNAIHLDRVFSIVLNDNYAGNSSNFRWFILFVSLYILEH